MAQDITLMRFDMDKIIVERPRVGRYSARKGRALRDGDYARTHLGMGWISDRQAGTKAFNENLSPLKRYLDRQVNRPWSKVYSEIRANIDAGNTVQAHILQHIYDFITVHPRQVTPSKHAPCGLAKADFRRLPWGHGIQVGDLYVDPADGIIKRAKARWRPPVVSRAAQAFIAPGALFVAPIQGVWYAFNLAPYSVVSCAGSRAPAPAAKVFEIERQIFDSLSDPIDGPVLASDKIALQRWARRYGEGMVPVRKRQLGRKELTALGLENRPD